MCHQGTPWFRANRRSGTGNKQPLLKRWLQERPRMNGKPGFAKQRRAQNQGERQNKTYTPKIRFASSRAPPVAERIGGGKSQMQDCRKPEM